jgi:hypothetical protein
MSWRNRLQCAGPRGSDRSDTSATPVTSVTTSTDSQHASLIIEQSPLDVPIPSKAPRLREPDQPKEDDTITALREIAGLLVTAYRRQQEIRQVPEDHAVAEPYRGLALSGKPSVHGVRR